MNAPLDKTILRLGYGGLVPFAGLAVLLWLVPPRLQGVIALSLLGYGALIASFLGGIHWGTGFLMGDAAPRTQFVWGVVPSLLAWLALMLPPRTGLVMLALVLLACFLADRMTYPAIGLGRWLPMRLQLTVVAVISCLLGALRLWMS
jgi:Protein of unknown function (DUF3429)